jgi:hypothetical protein
MGILGALLHTADRLGDSTGIVSSVAGFTAGATYLLCRDALNLRFRRSIGKALFDLRPLVVGAGFTGNTRVWASVRRNAVPPLVVSLIVVFYMLSSIVGVLITLFGIVIVWPIYVLVCWFKGWETLGNRWSRTRVVDADCGESVALRP